MAAIHRFAEDPTGQGKWEGRRRKANREHEIGFPRLWPPGQAGLKKTDRQSSDSGCGCVNVVEMRDKLHNKDFCAELRRRAYRFTRRSVASDADADDIVQKAFGKLLYRDPEDVRNPWGLLRTELGHQIATHHRQQKTARRVRAAQEQLAPASAPSAEPVPDRTALLAETEAFFRRLVEESPAHERSHVEACLRWRAERVRATGTPDRIRHRVNEKLAAFKRERGNRMWSFGPLLMAWWCRGTRRVRWCVSPVNSLIAVVFAVPIAAVVLAPTDPQHLKSDVDSTIPRTNPSSMPVLFETSRADTDVLEANPSAPDAPDESDTEARVWTADDDPYFSTLAGQFARFPVTGYGALKLAYRENRTVSLSNAYNPRLDAGPCPEAMSCTYHRRAEDVLLDCSCPTTGMSSTGLILVLWVMDQECAIFSGLTWQRTDTLAYPLGTIQHSLTTLACLAKPTHEFALQEDAWFNVDAESIRGMICEELDASTPACALKSGLPRLEAADGVSVFPSDVHWWYFPEASGRYQR